MAYNPHHYPLPSPPPTLGLTDLGGYTRAQADCLCQKENTVMGLTQWEKKSKSGEEGRGVLEMFKEPAAPCDGQI